MLAHTLQYWQCNVDGTCNQSTNSVHDSNTCGNELQKPKPMFNTLPFTTIVLLIDLKHVAWLCKGKERVKSHSMLLRSLTPENGKGSELFTRTQKKEVEGIEGKGREECLHWLFLAC